MRLFWAVLISVIISVTTCSILFSRNTGAGKNFSESAYDRVMQTGTLRCGYNIVPPYFQKDPNTGQFSGFTYDIMMAIGQGAGLKIDWVSEIGVGDAAAMLDTNKIDAMCVPLLLSPPRAKTMLPVKAAFYTPITAYARADDKRFDGDLDKINQKDIRVSAIDGDFSYDLAMERFPKATLKSLPQTSSVSDVLLQVTTQKADVVMMVQEAIDAFNQNNSHKLRAVAHVPAVRMYSEHIFLKRGEYHLQGMLNNAINRLINDGEIDTILNNHNKKYGGEHKAPVKAFSP